MKQRILVAVIGAPALIAVLAAAPEWATFVLLWLLSLIGAHELLAAVCGSQKAARWTGLAGALAAFTLVTVYWSDEDFAGSALPVLGEFFLAAMLVLLFATAIVEYGGRHPMTFRDICAILVSGVAIPLSFGCLLLLRLMPDGGGLVLIPLVAAFCSDSAALFTGMACGRHKLAPHVSPKKTVEGAIGGLAGGMLGMVIFRVIFYFCTVRALHIGWCIALGLLGAIMGQLGDLSFSLIKREFGIKDYGRLLPGHGGVLDRFDSVLFAAPVVWLVICHVPL